MKAKTIIGLALLAVGLFWPQIQEKLPDLIPNFPSKPDPAIMIDQPNDAILERVSSIASLVTDKNDRDELGIFNHIFSERVTEWSADSQQVNDLYVSAAQKHFSDRLLGKYDGYGGGIKDLMKATLGTQNHTVSKGEKEELSENFDGLAYSLVN